jgi:3-mercaptopyruvate sulfurtransferase SseA
MAGHTYKKGAEARANADIDWLLDSIKVALIDLNDYTPDYDADEFLADIPGAAIVATSASLTGKTNVLGVLDADDVVLAAVTGDQSEAVLIYQDTGVGATSRLLWLYDSPGVPGLPITPNGTAITITWNNGPNKIVNTAYADA